MGSWIKDFTIQYIEAAKPATFADPPAIWPVMKMANTGANDPNAEFTKKSVTTNNFTTRLMFVNIVAGFM
jgi:hypothetical protein